MTAESLDDLVARLEFYRAQTANREYYEAADCFSEAKEAIVALRARAERAEADRAKIRESFATSSTDEENRLRAEVVALREALRKYAITAKIRPPCYVCELCENYWTPGEPERHFAGCLAEKDKGD